MSHDNSVVFGHQRQNSGSGLFKDQLNGKLCDKVAFVCGKRRQI